MPLPQTYRVRAAALDDTAALVRLEQHFPTDRLRPGQWRHLLTRANARIFVIDHAGAPIANVVMLFRRGTRRARIYSLIVDPSHRGYGLGRHLLAQAELTARQRGCSRIGLEVRADNAPALRLYIDRGYTTVGVRRGFYEDGSEALRLDKPLLSRAA